MLHATVESIQSLILCLHFLIEVRARFRDRFRKSHLLSDFTIMWKCTAFPSEKYMKISLKVKSSYQTSPG